MPPIENTKEQEEKIGYKDWFDRAVKLDDKYEDEEQEEVEVIVEDEDE